MLLLIDSNYQFLIYFPLLLNLTPAAHHPNSSRPTNNHQQKHKEDNEKSFLTSLDRSFLILMLMASKKKEARNRIA